MTRFSGSKFATALQPRSVANYVAQLIIVGAGYFVLAKAALTLASIYTSAVPIWPPAGFALAAVLVCGLRVWPAIFAAAFAAGPPAEIPDANAADWVLPACVATASTIEALVGGSLISVWSQGRRARRRRQLLPGRISGLG